MVRVVKSKWLYVLAAVVLFSSCDVVAELLGTGKADDPEPSVTFYSVMVDEDVVGMLEVFPELAAAGSTVTVKLGEGGGIPL
jgi:hypothetical protein